VAATTFPSAANSPGQDDHICALAASQAIEQRQRRREIGIDPRAALRSISCREIADRALEGKRREHANDIHRRFAFCLSMISAQTRSAFVARENRCPLFRIML